MPEDTDPRGRAIYADYIKEQQEAQEARKVSLEQRGLAVITTSGALVTLLFGLTALYRPAGEHLRHPGLVGRAPRSARSSSSSSPRSSRS